MGGYQTGDASDISESMLDLSCLPAGAQSVLASFIHHVFLSQLPMLPSPLLARNVP